MSSAKMRAFLAVARHGSFSAGARALGLSQPTLTTQVQAMERQYNLELFHRRGRRIELSDVGRQLLPIAQAMAALDLDAHNLYELMQQHPDIELETSFSPEKETLARLFNFDINVAILALSEFDQRFDTQLYRRYPIIAVVRDDHPWAQQEQVHVEQINGCFAKRARGPGNWWRKAASS